MGFVNEEDDRRGRSLDFINDRTQAVFELTLHAGASLEQPEIEHMQRDVFQCWRNISRNDLKRKTLDDGSLPDAGLARQNGIVLPAAHKHIHDLTDLLIAPVNRVHLAFAGLCREVGGVLSEGRLLAALRTDGSAGFARCHTATS